MTEIFWTKVTSCCQSEPTSVNHYSELSIEMIMPKAPWGESISAVWLDKMSSKTINVA